MTEEDINHSREKSSWIYKILNILSRKSQTRGNLESLIADAAENEVIDNDAKDIIVGAMQVSEMHARDIIIPRTQMKVIAVDSKLEDILPLIIQSAHSRYPVVGENPDDVLGILLAKDLLPQILDPKNVGFDVRELMRPTLFIPESKRLNVLLREFRQNRNHMAIVIDEYGGVAGLITIEDVLEEIVGEIEDETDAEEDPFIRKIASNNYFVSALTPIEDFNKYFEVNFSDGEFDTIGGLVSHAFGYMPTRNEITEIQGFKFKVITADQRKIHSLHMKFPKS
jgi:magnesium and cobalt transporter